jgi:glycosyltransferase involved in cell wall biosynthesis
VGEPGSRRAPAVLYLTYDGLLEPLGEAQVVPYVARLARRAPIEILSFEKPADLRDADRIRALSARLASATVAWHRRPYHARPTVPATAFDIAVGAAFAARRGVGLVHARSYVPAMMALLARWVTGVPFVFDTRSLLIDERVESGMWSEGSATVRAMRRIERRLFAAASSVVMVTRNGARLVGERFGSGVEAKTSVVPPCADLGRFRPEPNAERLREELGLGRGPVIVHAGALGTWYLDEQTFAVGVEFARRTGGSFLVLTRELDRARRLAASSGGDVTIRSVPHSEMPRWLAACDAGVALVRPDPCKRASTPVKIGEFLACGLAVASTRGVGDLEAQFEGSDVAFAVDPAAPAEVIADRLAVAARRPDRRSEARSLAERLYDLERGVEAYEAIYRRLLPPPAVGQVSR